MKKKTVIIPVIVLVIVAAIGSVAFAAFRPKNSGNDSTNATPAPTPRAKVNIIDIKDRPYVTLQPLAERNTLEISVHNLPKKANDVEVLLEYDRNKGVMDAVLKNFTLDNLPYVNQIFLGSKSSGGHITYHEDVIGGTMTLTFSGEETYALQVPWRYDDTQPHYTELASSDAKFQLLLDQPFRTPKVIVMESPGLPAKLDGKILAGPYLVRGVGPLPAINTKLTIHLSDPVDKVALYGFNGQKWQQFDSTLDGRTVTASVPLVETYVVVQ